ncbi:MAG TPA: Rrf2 family transcriptional regulator [Acidimicrobiia bacterium]|nr:Rrf2 family transcriptional regulator [Acidimicrobiia bacterium]
MRLSEGVEWGLHCAVVLAVLPSDAALSTARLADYHGVPEAYLAKHLQAMSRAGILVAGTGPRGGYRLARPPADISVLDVVEAVDGDDPAFRCLEIRRRGPAAVAAREYRSMCGIHRVMVEADEAWRGRLARTSVADLAAGVALDASPKMVEKFGQWLQEVMP